MRKMAALGVQALSKAELLAVLLNSVRWDLNAIDLGNQLLNDFGAFKGLHRADSYAR